MGKKGRGSGGGGGRGGRGGRGRGLGFVPFSGHGQTLGGRSGSSSNNGSGGYNSPRGGQPFRGRGRGGTLSAQGQNRVAFDYSALSRRRGGDDVDEEEVDEDEDDDEDFSIEPPAGYKHKVKPHLEDQELSDPEATATSKATADLIQETNMKSVISIPINRSAQDSPKPRWNRTAAAPTHFPEFHTSRGVPNGRNSRPPEETEDAKYLAGIPGLRRAQGARRNQTQPRYDSEAANPLRMPVAFVKPSGLYPDPLEQKPASAERFEAPRSDQDQARQFEEARQHAFDQAMHSKGHAGLGFTQEHPPAVGDRYEMPRPPPPPQTFDAEAALQDDQKDLDEVNALLAAFPGSKELAPGESMFGNEPQSWNIPDFQMASAPAVRSRDSASLMESDEPAQVSSISQEGVVEASEVAQESEDRLESDEAEALHSAVQVSAEEETSSDDDEIILVPAHSAGYRAPKAEQSFAESDSDEERQLNEILAQTQQQVDEAADVDEFKESTEASGFIIDLTGDDPMESEPISKPSTSKTIALGDVLTPAARHGNDLKHVSTAKRNQRSRGQGRKKRLPREGDSDLDWGSDGPPDGMGPAEEDEQDLVDAAAGISFNEGRSSQSTTQDDIILAKAIRADRHEWEPEEDDFLSIQPATNGKSRNRGGKRAKRSLLNQAAGQRSRKAHQDAIVADYMENIMGQQADEEDEDEVNQLFQGDMIVESMNPEPTEKSHIKGKTKSQQPLSKKLEQKSDLDAMIQFMNGMDPQKGGRQMTFGDIEDEQYIDQVNEWLTESEEDDQVGDDENNLVETGAATATTKAEGMDQAFDRSESRQVNAEASEDEELAEQLRIILETDTSDDEEDGEEGHSRSDKGGSDSDSSSDSESNSEDDSSEDSDEDGSDSEDEDDGMFKGKNSWADDDQEFIDALTSQMGSGKRSQRKLFKAISRGDFSDMVDDMEIEIDSDDPAFGLGSVPTARNGKRKGRKWNDDDVWAEELQQQWDKDRASKATKKQQRAIERAIAAVNPFPNTHGQKKARGKMSKKEAKQARRAEKRDARAALKAHADSALAAVNAAGGIDRVDERLLSFGGVPDLSSLPLDQRFARNMEELNEQIEMFLSQKGRTTLTLQPMDKFARAEVHSLAAAYNLKSQSKGKGRDRFPTLIKTSRSGVGINHRKIASIVRSNAGASFGNETGRSDFKGKGKRSDKKIKAERMIGRTGGGERAPRNREGEEVGFGADKIGADNIGHRLLAAMGWSEGMGIGASGGMADPVAATVKVSKGGLGF